MAIKYVIYDLLEIQLGICGAIVAIVHLFGGGVPALIIQVSYLI